MKKTENKTELPENVRAKISEAVELWADENLNGKPAVLATMIFFALESEFIKKINEISERF